MQKSIMTLLIYEDRSDLRASLEMLLGGMPDLSLAGAFSNCKNVAEEVLQLQPDVVLMDINMPEYDGLYGLQIIKEIRPETEVIMFTVFEDEDKIFASLEGGASGYLLKDTPPMKLYEAIRDVISGGAPMSPGIARRVLERFKKPPVAHAQTFHLSKRETEILTLLVKGYTYKRIAAECFISMDTVRGHLKNTYTKLQVNSGKEAVAKALRHKIVEGD
ncbi:MAG: response regulator transcription factor [Saprospiraceae bacterium]|nr:response regulator transcription factor [Saprospiraceae bacterium]